MNEVEKMYPGSEETLYDVAGLAWQNCSNHISRFSTFKLKYTPAYIAEAAAAIKAAQAIPNINARRATGSNKRTKLAMATAAACKDWQTLSVYIEGAFEPEEVHHMRKLAGSGFYGKAAHEDWGSAETMLLMASQFMAKFADDLSDGEMPAAFATAFNAKKTAFDQAYKAYNETKVDVQAEMDNKILANNAVYTSMKSMLKDAKAIFNDEPQIGKQFVYSSLVKLVNKKTIGGFLFSLRDKATGKPVTGATIVLQPKDKTTKTGKTGTAELFVPKGTYSYTITATGYEAAQGTAEAVGGTMHLVELELEKAAVTV